MDLGVVMQGGGEELAHVRRRVVASSPFDAVEHTQVLPAERGVALAVLCGPGKQQAPLAVEPRLVEVHLAIMQLVCGVALDATVEQMGFCCASAYFFSTLFGYPAKLSDLKRVTQSIKKAVGGLAEDLDAYLREELFHGRTVKRTHDFGVQDLRPLMEQIGISSLTIADVEEYLHARHAKEANRIIAQPNPGVPEMQDGGSGMEDAEADASSPTCRQPIAPSSTPQPHGWTTASAPRASSTWATAWSRKTRWTAGNRRSSTTSRCSARTRTARAPA